MLNYSKIIIMILSSIIECKVAEYATSKYATWYEDCFELKTLEKQQMQGHSHLPFDSCKQEIKSPI